MSAPANDEEDLKPTQTAGYTPGAQKSLQEYAKLDAEDESLQKWKASLGLAAGGAGGSSGPRKVTVASLSLHSPTLSTPITLDLSNPQSVSSLSKNPVTIKEGAEFSVEIKFKVEGEVVAGLQYLQVVKRSGIKVDKEEAMIGSYGPSNDWITKRFDPDEAPSGMIARTGTYFARSRVTDDDGHVWSDFEWSFVLRKEWDSK